MQNRPEQFAKKVIELQATYTEQWHHDRSVMPNSSDQSVNLIVEQHGYNFDLWHEEDKAREPNAKDSDIAHVKRNIDALNQNRNDAITEIDELLEKTLFASISNRNDLPWNSETIGSIVDRLSIASLKVFHMQEQVERTDASNEHIESCKQKVFQLAIQRDDLAKALQEFVNDVLAGRKQNKLYRQFKMYNDPSLNPKIYQKK